MTQLSHRADHEGCGCCGQYLSGRDDYFCVDCLAHVWPKEDRPPWERTYFARHGKPCPWQVTG